MRSEPAPPSWGPRNATPPPPENIGSRQHQCMLSFGGEFGTIVPIVLAVEPGPSESDESSEAGCSFIRFGDLEAPGAHQNLVFFGRSPRCVVWDSPCDEFGVEGAVGIDKEEPVMPDKNSSKLRILRLFFGRGLSNAQLAHNVFRHPIQCILILHVSQRSRMVSLH